MKNKYKLIVIDGISFVIGIVIGYFMSSKTVGVPDSDDVYMEEFPSELLSYSFRETPDSLIDLYDFSEFCYVRSLHWKLHIGDKTLRPMFIGFKSLPSYEQIEHWPSVRYLIDASKYHVKPETREQIYETDFAIVFIKFCN